jgi:dihydrofolate reductase (trimethoprim resistance protein)
MTTPVGFTWKIGDLVRKKGTKSGWHGRVCGWYITDLTPEGYAVESLLEKFSVQVWPKEALEDWDGRYNA